MKKICVIVDMMEACFDIKYIEEEFPCFIEYNKINNTYCEVTITCRQEDAATIEDRLARVV